MAQDFTELLMLQSTSDTTDRPETDHSIPLWRRTLLTRLSEGVGRSLVDADLRSLAWNETAGTLTVECSALLSELRARGAASNVFRSRFLRH
jgi:hypothetical protein